METYYNSVAEKTEVFSLGFSYAGNNVLISKPFIETHYLERIQKSSDIVFYR